LRKVGASHLVDPRAQQLTSLASGLVKPLDALTISHTYNSSGTITPNTTSDAQFQAFVNNFIPARANFASEVRDDIESQYGSKSFASQRQRLERTIRDASITCNTRFLYDAYMHTAAHRIPVYMMQYSLGKDTAPSIDSIRLGSDVIPIFWNNDMTPSTPAKAVRAEFCI
jgi:hypothetical protein